MRTFLAAAVFCVAAGALADEPAKAEAKPAAKAKPFMAVAPSDLKWTAMSEVGGVQTALLWGSPKQGASGSMVKIPAGQKHALHTHTANLRQVIISGTWIIGPDEASAKEYGSGSFVFTPGGWKHYSACKEGAECVFYQDGSGPFDIKPAEEQKK